MFTETTLSQEWMFTETPLKNGCLQKHTSQEWMFTEIPLSQAWMFTETPLSQEWMFTETPLSKSGCSQKHLFPKVDVHRNTSKSGFPASKELEEEWEHNTQRLREFKALRGPEKRKACWIKQTFQYALQHGATSTQAHADTLFKEVHCNFILSLYVASDKSFC